MRTKTLSLTLLSTLIALNALGQAGTGGTGGTTGGTGASGGITTSGGSSTAGGTTTQGTGSGTANQGGLQTVPPRTIIRNQANQNRPGFAPVTNSLIGQGQVGITNNNLLPQTNQFLVTSNQLTAQPTNGILPSGTVPGGTAVAGTPAALLQDRAFNANDRTALVQIQRGLRGIFPSPATMAGVHFQILQGVATVVGRVQTPAQRQRVMEVVRATPNITQVNDQLSVAGPGAPASPTGLGNQSTPAGTLTPTGVTNQFGISPTAVPGNVQTVPTNALPPVRNP